MGYLTINDLDLAAYIAHLHIFALLMVTLDHISNTVDNTVEESWARRVKVGFVTTVVPLLKEDAWVCRQTQMHASVAHIAKVDNHKEDAVSRLNHLTVA